MERNDWVVADRGKVLLFEFCWLETDWNDVKEPVDAEPGINLVDNDNPCVGL